MLLLQINFSGTIVKKATCQFQFKFITVDNLQCTKHYNYLQTYLHLIQTLQLFTNTFTFNTNITTIYKHIYF